MINVFIDHLFQMTALVQSHKAASPRIISFLIFPLSSLSCVLSEVKYRKEVFVFRDAVPVLMALFLAKTQGD